METITDRTEVEAKPEKAAVVQEVRERFSSAGAVMLTDYRGLKVGDLAALRRSLREAGGEYKIYKNTLVRRAVNELSLEGMDELLVGPTAVAFVEGDAVGVARALRDYSRSNPALVLKGGLLGDKLLSPADIRALADIPPREVLLARIAGGFAAPMQQFAGLLQALPRNLAYGIKALIDQGGPAGASATVAPASDDSSTVEIDEPENSAESGPTTVAEAADAAEATTAEAVDAAEVSTPDAADAAEVVSDESPEEA